MTAPDWPYAVERLARHHNREAFSCGKPELDRYFRELVGQDERKRVAVAYVAVVRGSATVAGFYTLAARSIPCPDLPAEITRRLPRYDTIPATLIGRLALDENHRGRGLGDFLLADAVTRSLAESRRVASWAVVVDAKDDAASAFYRAFGFIPFPDQPRRLFLPMETVAKLPR